MSLLNAYGLCRAVADAEVSVIESNDTSLCKFSVAFNRSYLVNKEWKKETTFVDVVAWGKMAESLGVVRKGQELFLKGRIDQNSWKNSEGKKRSKLQFYVTEFGLVEARERTGGEASSQQGGSVNKSNASPPDQQAPAPELNQTEIPF